jgi:UDP-N-acetylglucosamine acyltransferase
MIHPSAVIAASARLGAGVTVGPFAVIEDDVVIGDDCEIAAHAVIKRHTRMGVRNKVFEHAILGGTPQDFKFSADTLSFTTIGDDNLFREGVTVHRGSRTDSFTRIGDGCFFMAYAHVAHDCQLASGIIMVNNSGVAGEVVVEDKAIISGNVSVHQFCRIGRNAMIGLSTKLVQDALPFCITDGNPGRARGLNVVGMRRNGFSREDIAAVKDGYRLLARRAPLDEVIASLNEAATPAARHLAGFIANSSDGKRGFAHPSD